MEVEKDAIKANDRLIDVQKQVAESEKATSDVHRRLTEMSIRVGPLEGEALGLK